MRKPLKLDNLFFEKLIYLIDLLYYNVFNN